MEALRSAARRLWGPARPSPTRPSPTRPSPTRPSPTRPSPTRPRPFWLRPGGGEGRPRGVLAATLGELREQAASVLGLPLPPALALAEDGTLLENEEFFATLPPHTALVALGPGQSWEPPEAPPRWDFGGGPRGAPEERPGPRWDLGALGSDGLLRELLRLLAALARALGRALLGLSGALGPLLEGPPGQQGAP